MRRRGRAAAGSRRALVLGFGAGWLLLAACVAEPGPQERAGPAVSELADRVFEHWLEEDLYLRHRYGLPITRLPDLTLDQARRRAEFAASVLAELDAIDPAALSQDDRLTSEVARQLMVWQHELPDHYWLELPVTPYASGWLLDLAHHILGGHPLSTAAERDAYLALIGEYGDWLDQIHAKLERQAEMGIRVARPALDGVRGTLSGFAERRMELSGVEAVRLEGVAEADRDDFRSRLEAVVEDRVGAGYERLLALLGDDYGEASPSRVGLSRQPGGEEYYRYLVRYYTTLDLTPEQVHETGLAWVSTLSGHMAALRRELGFDGSQREFHQRLQTDPRFLAATPEEVEARYLGYVARVEARIPDFFEVLPRAPYGLRRLDPASEGSITFGYYQPPSAANPVGEYRYNASNLAERSLFSAGPLIYHELIPGHHFQIALQNENQELPALRREATDFTAFVEGWAEYAADLPGEMGLYDDPWERYARLADDMVLSARLVVDTGMNLLGWSLADARAYLREHTMLSDLEIATETLRYSTDIPGQALAYKIGHAKLDDLRSGAQAELGEAFDVRDFHAVVLGGGALPLSVLEGRVARWVARRAAAPPAGG